MKSSDKISEMMSDRRKEVRKRILAVEVLLLLLVAFLGVKAIEIQVFKSTDLSKKAEREYTGYFHMKGKRGEIFDRHMNRLGTTTDALSVAASPVDIKDPDNDAAALANILNLNKKELKTKFSTKRRFTWIKKQVSPKEAEAIRALNLEGVFFKNDVIRFYPNRTLAAQVVGFTGSDGKGLEGVEFQFNDVLEGRQAKIGITKDGNGRLIDTDHRLEEQFSGDSIVMTIDRTIQYISECALKKAVTEHNAKSGMAIVMKPDTGEILAMANYPDFNPNSFSEYDKKLWRNRVVTDPFEPGSTMKVFLAAAVLDRGLCGPTSIFFCENGDYRIGRNTIHDTHPHGWLTLAQIIKFSSNIGAVKVSEVVGRETLHSSLTAFGFGKKTGIDCPGESCGLLMPYSRWTPIDTGAISFGQGVSVSALQLVSAAAAIANDGKLMKPMLVKQILSPGGEVKHDFGPTMVRQAVSRQAAMDVRKMMLSVVEEEGTGTKAAINGYTVCGKTGTAQKVAEDGKGYSHNRYNSLFVGFAPYKKPELAVLVVVDEPKGIRYGGVVAAPAFKTIITESFHYLNIPPDAASEELLAQIAQEERL